MHINAILHAGLLVQDTARSLAFYRDLLGLRVAEGRPDLGFPGVWLRVGEQQIHLQELPSPDPAAGRPAHPGRDRHLALRVHDLEALARALEAAGVDYTRSRSGRSALFCRDPDGNGLEFVA